MIVKARKRFLNDLSKIKSVELLEEVNHLLETINKSSSPEKIPNFKWLTGYSGKGRIRIGDYRLGVEVTGNTMIIKCFLHREIIYGQFP